MDDVYWDLTYDINLPRNGKVKVHGASWDEETKILHVFVSTSDVEGSIAQYQEGVPLYEPAEDGYEELVGMNPVEVGDPPQSLVKSHHKEMAARVLGDDDAEA